MDSFFKSFYDQELKVKLSKDLGYENINQVPKISKIVVNAGIKGAQDSKLVNYVFEGISAITGQKPMRTKARKSIAGFKIREGLQIGCMVSLRGKRMYNFLEKLIRAVIPAIRDFRGLNASFDSQGNYNLGLKDWSVFSEIVYEKFPNSHGLNITMHIVGDGSARASFALLKGFGMPFVEVNK